MYGKTTLLLVQLLLIAAALSAECNYALGLLAVWEPRPICLAAPSQMARLLFIAALFELAGSGTQCHTGDLQGTAPPLDA